MLVSCSLGLLRARVQFELDAAGEGHGLGTVASDSLVAVLPLDALSVG